MNKPVMDRRTDRRVSGRDGKQNRSRGTHKWQRRHSHIKKKKQTDRQKEEDNGQKDREEMNLCMHILKRLMVEDMLRLPQNTVHTCENNTARSRKGMFGAACVRWQIHTKTCVLQYVNEHISQWWPVNCM